MSNQGSGLSNQSGNLTTFVTSGSYGYSVKAEDERPIKTPDNFLTTRVVETMGGWMGQIIIFKNIVWQSPDGHEKECDALHEVNQHLVECLAKLFA
jgi:hypothetical protein